MLSKESSVKGWQNMRFLTNYSKTWRLRTSLWDSQTIFKLDPFKDEFVTCNEFSTVKDFSESKTNVSEWTWISSDLVEKVKISCVTCIRTVILYSLYMFRAVITKRMSNFQELMSSGVFWNIFLCSLNGSSFCSFFNIGLNDLDRTSWLNCLFYLLSSIVK